MNPAAPAPGTFLARLEDVPDPGGIALDFAKGEARFSMLLTRLGDQAFGYENNCPHADYPLELPDGRVLMQDGYILCAIHLASFELTTGACAGGPCYGVGLRRIPVDVRDGNVFTRLPSPPDPYSDRGGGA